MGVIDAIAATPGKNDKVRIIAEYAMNPAFQRVLKAAIDPLITYGVRKFLPIPGAGTGEFDDGTWFLLDILAKRESSGNAALDGIHAEMCRLNAPSCELLKRIILKDLRAGFDASTTNKAIKGLIRTFPYMRCSLPKAVKMDDFFEDGAIAQEKADGMFLNLDHEVGGLVRLTTRQGNELPADAFGPLVKAVRRSIASGTQLHGEMVVMRPTGVDGEYDILDREIGNGILNHVAADGDFADDEIPMYLAWDQIPLTAVVPKGKHLIEYKDRLAALTFQVRLMESLHMDIIETVFVKDMAEAWAFFRKKLAEGKEGAVVKKSKAIWTDGTSKEQVKLKLKAPVELRIKGFVEGNGKYAGMLGAFQMESECGQLKVNVNARGDAQRAEVWANQNKYLEGIATVEGNSIMEPGDSSPFHSLFLPVLSEIRTDKTEADDLQRIRDQFQAAMEAA